MAEESKGILDMGGPQPPQSIGTTAGKLVSGLIDILKPEILTRRKHSGGVRRTKTAWLDGLRGTAAFCVALMHLTVYTHAGIEHCYGGQTYFNQYNTSPLALPFIRIPFTGGHFAVTVFFVISGYVVPRRLISLINEGRRDEFIDSVQSAIVRRPIRLYVPVILSTGWLVIMWHFFRVTTAWPTVQPTLLGELKMWVVDNFKFIYIHRIGWLFTYYNVHTWTIPVELRGSMWMFVWLFAFHTVGTRYRMLATLGLVIYLVMGAPAAQYACFFAGMLQSEMDMLAESGANVRLPWDPITKFMRERPKFRMFVYHMLLLGGLFLAGQPASDQHDRHELLGNCPGWGPLRWFIPAVYDELNQYRWFWLFWGSWMVLVSVKEIAWAKWIFETNFCQYLGKHSFALYLVHGPTIGVVGERLFYLTGLKEPITPETKLNFGHYTNAWKNAPWWPFPEKETPGLEGGFWVCIIICMPLFLYLAEIGTRCFDEPSVRFSSWVWRKMKTLK
ncbi:uncharacterized protein K489DRAFT_362562 [Dissoconium aciculare CBS 342.82]|uniref:Acyltransferase 3 domain-containing protein n=1 Tax=Dissoconium aciculare CBS 342.82 TaxID=1314786 RepID=A0A6J3LW99_9PEZI|nr:uncharacterized protein K489DRAFT_362562 [Dissoconium aciculare CBS 342.82]KAF1819938.1 hypothetical protein K489DRAFT_362562 [Dissoconium aciculare CBS 342.82]